MRWQADNEQESIVITKREGGYLHLGFACAECRSCGHLPDKENTCSGGRAICDACDGAGFFGIDAKASTNISPCEPGRVAMLQVRYEAGEPLWNTGDTANGVEMMSKRMILEPSPA